MRLTFLEVVIVVAIVGILTAVALSAYTDYQVRQDRAVYYNINEDASGCYDK